MAAAASSRAAVLHAITEKGNMPHLRDFASAERSQSDADLGGAAVMLLRTNIAHQLDRALHPSGWIPHKRRTLRMMSGTREEGCVRCELRGVRTLRRKEGRRCAHRQHWEWRRFRLQIAWPLLLRGLEPQQPVAPLHH